MTTGVLFGLLVAAHVLRVFEEGMGPARNPWFILITASGVILCLWAWRVLRSMPRDGS
jgi:hypothetical protein